LAKSSLRSPRAARSPPPAVDLPQKVRGDMEKSARADSEGGRVRDRVVHVREGGRRLSDQVPRYADLRRGARAPFTESPLTAPSSPGK
jgi:hypothetical protein